MPPWELLARFFSRPGCFFFPRQWRAARHCQLGEYNQRGRNRIGLEGYPWEWMPAGVTVVLTVLAINFIDDGLRDAFDPRSKR